MTENEAIEQLRIEFLGDSDLQRKAKNLAIEALEKQIAKKPVHEGCYDLEENWHEWIGISGRPYELCPNCKQNLCCEMPYDIKPKYCPNCGQRLDWRDEK